MLSPPLTAQLPGDSTELLGAGGEGCQVPLQHHIPSLSTLGASRCPQHLGANCILLGREQSAKGHSPQPPVCKPWEQAVLPLSPPPPFHPPQLKFIIFHVSLLQPRQLAERWRAEKMSGAAQHRCPPTAPGVLLQTQPEGARLRFSNRGKRGLSTPLAALQRDAGCQQLDLDPRTSKEQFPEEGDCTHLSDLSRPSLSARLS